MYVTGNKKMLNMLILEILREYTDEKHALTQQEIIKKLKVYGMECDRRSVKNNVTYLKDLGYDISMDKGYRLLSREFDDAELRMLIDSVLFSKAISNKQAKTLIEKLKALGNRYFSANVNNISKVTELSRTENKQVLYSLDAINDAITEKKKIGFILNSMGTDLKLHPVDNRERIVNPYQIVANNGRFYLLCNYDKYDNAIHIRVDNMTDVRILEEKARPMKDVPELANGFNLPKHMAEHAYMFAGPSVVVKMRAENDLLGNIVDWFGKDIMIVGKSDSELTVVLHCNEHAMRFWALQYGPYVEILEPKSLRDTLKKDVEDMYRKYK